MLLTEKRRRILTGIALTLGVLATRIPFMARYLEEFDSVDFAIGTFRFDLAQFTPHPPGYILHVLAGKFFTNFAPDINAAFIWLAILLSIGSVLFMWRVGARLRGERVGLIVAVLWLFAPMFWYFGEVATCYPHEAFFTSALLYLGIRLLRSERRSTLWYWVAVVFSLAIGARQSTLIFFLPAGLYLLYKVRPSA